MIKIDFSFETDYGSFKDALYLPDDHSLTVSEIDALKQQRVDDWITSITIPIEAQE